MRYLNRYTDFNTFLENSKNDPLPEITQGGKLGIVLIGTPGIGKSTFAKNFISHKNQNIKIFSTDDVSLTLTKKHDVYRKGSSELNLKKLFMFIKSGGSFIYDTTGVQRENVENVTNVARDNGYNIIYIHLMGTLDLSLRQNLQRERNVPSDYIKNVYESQFKNMKFFSSLNPDSYYVIYNIDGKYKFMKYDGNQLFRRKVDKYVPFNEDVDNKEFSIKDVYLNSISLSDDYKLTFYDLNYSHYLETEDINKNTDKFKNFELSKVIGNNLESEFTIEVTNTKVSLSLDEFVDILNEMYVTIQYLKTKGWTLSDFLASTDDDSVGELRFHHIRFTFSKPKVKVSDMSLQNAFTKEQITDVFNSDGLDVDDITFYDEYIEVEFTSRNYNRRDDTDERLDSITKRLGGREYENDYDTVKIWFNQE
jgi:predicted kinase